MADGPSADEVEISIFGPGKGESILLHLGGGSWIVVDSCIDARDGSLPALEYLRRIGVNASLQVRLVVATHAHDDHIAGMARMVEACESATFVASQAIVSSEFFALLELDQVVASGLTPRLGILREYQAVLDLVMARKTASGRPPLVYAKERAVLSATDGSAGVGNRASPAGACQPCQDAPHAVPHRLAGWTRCRR